MRILLDTCTLLWLELSPGEVPAWVIKLMADRNTELYLSAASAWEIAVKWNAGRLRLPVPPAEFIASARAKSEIAALPIEESAAFQLTKLPKLHGDPFDRILIAQAIEHGLAIATPDLLIKQYPIRTIWN